MSVIRVRDREGREVFAGMDSSLVRRGLADGTLVEVVTDASDSEDAAPGDGVDSGQSRRRSRNQERTSRPASVDGDQGVSGAEDTD